jgi:hypothetical protein
MALSHLVVPMPQLNSELDHTQFHIGDFFPPLTESPSLEDVESKIETSQADDDIYTYIDPSHMQTIASHYSVERQVPAHLHDPVPDSVHGSVAVTGKGRISADSWIENNLVMVVLLTIAGVIIIVVGCIGVWYVMNGKHIILKQQKRETSKSRQL